MIRRQQHNQVWQPLYRRKAYETFDLIERLNFKGTNYCIVLPIAHARAVVEWYHNVLRHPGASRLTKTIQTNFICPQLEQHVKDFTSSCHSCERIKDLHPREGQLVEKQTELNPLEEVAVDCVGPWKFKIGK